MNTEGINACVKLSFADTPFPTVVQKLVELGVHAYTADLIARRKTFYGADRESYDESMPLDTSPIAVRFDGERVAVNVRAIQRGEIGYAEFLRQIMEAGCASYRVFIGGRKVMYFGRDGEFYVEPFPDAID